MWTPTTPLSLCPTLPPPDAAARALPSRHTKLPRGDGDGAGAREADHLRSCLCCGRRRLGRCRCRHGQRDGVPLLLRHGRGPRVRVGVVWRRWRRSRCW